MRAMNSLPVPATKMLTMCSLEFSIAVAAAVILLTYCYWIRRTRRSAKYAALRLPPGSSGLPLIGEALELLIPGYSLDLHPFVRKRIQRYGSLFRTNVGGKDLIISTDPDFNRYIFQQEGKTIERSYLDLLNELFKPEDFNANDVHRYVRRVSLSQFGSESIREKLLSSFEEFVRETLRSWSSRDSVELISTSIVEVFGAFGIKQVFGNVENSRELSQRLMNFSRAALSFPVNIPGTTYHKCMKDKDRALKMIRDMIRARIASPQIDADDMLSKILAKDMNKVNFLSEELLTQMLFGVTYGASDTISMPLAFCLKFISENPAVLRELIAEHEEILKKRENSESFVSWEEYKSMNFTLQVVNETLRLTNTVPGIVRKALTDISVKGYTIPAGWKIMICYPAMHLDPNTYEDPLTFNPWRWKGVSPEFTIKNLVPFGGGINQCAGADYARASLCIFLHVLITNYRWSIMKGGDIIQNPVMQFKNGIHISICPKSDV